MAKQKILVFFLGLAGAVKFCEKNTGGSCDILVCDQSRGPTECFKQGISVFGSCLCKDGYCAVDGKCIPDCEFQGTCPLAPNTTTEMPSTTPAVPTEFSCEMAYMEECYKYTPFDVCCNQGNCAAAEAGTRCDWSYRMPSGPTLFNETFSWISPAEDVDCHRACDTLGDPSNSYSSYCPGGSLEHLEWYSKCPQAKDSYLRAIQKTPEKWCSSQASLKCKWDFRVYEKSTGQVRNRSGVFAYDSDDEESCMEACVALGDPSNLESEYCQDGNLTSRIQGCPAAKVSYDHGKEIWCSGGNVTFTEGPRRQITGGSHRSLRYSPVSMEATGPTGTEKPICHWAFQNNCQGKKPFSSCCSECANSIVTYQCTWKREYAGQRIPSTGEYKVEAFESEHWSNACDDVCDELGDKRRDATWLCNTHEVNKVLSRCELARAVFPTDIPWCRHTLSIAATETGREPGLAQISMIVFGATLLFGAVIVSTILSRCRVNDADGNQPTVGYQRMLPPQA